MCAFGEALSNRAGAQRLAPVSALWRLRLDLL